MRIPSPDFPAALSLLEPGQCSELPCMGSLRTSSPQGRGPGLELKEEEGGDQEACTASGTQVTLGISLSLSEHLELAI